MSTHGHQFIGGHSTAGGECWDANLLCHLADLMLSGIQRARRLNRPASHRHEVATRGAHRFANHATGSRRKSTTQYLAGPKPVARAFRRELKKANPQDLPSLPTIEKKIEKAMLAWIGLWSN
jgi:hypothetical protein